MRIEVTDTGCGIPPEALTRVSIGSSGSIHRDLRPPAAQASDLAIVQGIIVLHGGTVEIASEMGEGTRVTLLMPTGVPS